MSFFTVEQIISFPTVENVMPFSSVNLLIARSACQCVILWGSNNHMAGLRRLQCCDNA